VVAEICEEMANRKGYYISDLFTGHGIGHKLHMPPMVHHSYNKESKGIKMELGNVFTIEPIVIYRKPFKINWW
jgi:methionyl aminopeptidase